MDGHVMQCSQHCIIKKKGYEKKLGLLFPFFFGCFLTGIRYMFPGIDRSCKVPTFGRATIATFGTSSINH